MLILLEMGEIRSGVAEMEQSPSSVLVVGVGLAEMDQATINVTGDGRTFGGRRDRTSLSPIFLSPQ